MSKTFKSLIGSADLRSAIAAKLGAPVDNIPEANVADLAKSLGLAPTATVVEYTTVRTQKVGAYLAVDSIKQAGRDGAKVFARLGDPSDEVTAETVANLRAIADGFHDRSEAIHALADAAEADE